MGDDVPAWATGVASAFGLASAVLLTWWTVIAFTGGTLWPTSIHLEGSIGFGIVWLLFIDPLVATVLYWVFLVVLLPVAIAAAATRKHEG